MNGSSCQAYHKCCFGDWKTNGIELARLSHRYMHFVGQVKVSRVVFLSVVFILLCIRSIGLEQSWWEEEEKTTTFDQLQRFASLAQSVVPMATAADTQQATFAAGCFWSVELAYQRVPGVVKVRYLTLVCSVLRILVSCG